MFLSYTIYVIDENIFYEKYEFKIFTDFSLLFFCYVFKNTLIHPYFIFSLQLEKEKSQLRKREKKLIDMAWNYCRNICLSFRYIYIPNVDVYWGFLSTHLSMHCLVFVCECAAWRWRWRITLHACMGDKNKEWSLLEDKEMILSQNK